MSIWWFSLGGRYTRKALWRYVYNSHVVGVVCFYETSYALRYKAISSFVKLDF